MLIPTLAFAQDASGLGPATTGGGTSSPQTLNVLQPQNTTSGLQPANANNSGLTAPSQQNIQQAGNSDQIKVFLEGEGEGSKSLATDEGAASTPPYWILLVPLVIAAALWANKRRTAKPVMVYAPVASTEPAAPVAKPTKKKSKKKSKSKTKSKK